MMATLGARKLNLTFKVRVMLSNREFVLRMHNRELNDYALKGFLFARWYTVRPGYLFVHGVNCAELNTIHAIMKILLQRPVFI